MWLEFRVRFYVSDPIQLHEELTRYQFYLQVKKDLQSTRMSCSFESACLLGSYILQGLSCKSVIIRYLVLIHYIHVHVSYSV